MKKRNFKKRGFTLVEVLIAIIIGTILLVTLYAIYVANSRSYRQTISQQELAQNARISLERMSRDIRQTDRIVTSLPPTANDPLNPPPSYIQFQDGHQISAIQYIKYYLSGTNLMRQVLHYSFSAAPNTWVAWNARDAFNNLPVEHIDSDTIKADKISSLKFYGSKIIEIELSVANENDTYNFRTKIWGRNIQ
jgi:prepilin-type N-terminal cleavage/methylation domain-containing protein